MSSITCERESMMIDRSDAAAVIYRVSIAAFAYYPEKSETELGYDVDEDIDWAIEPVLALDADSLDTLRASIRDAITNPAADRQAFIRSVKALADY